LDPSEQIALAGHAVLRALREGLRRAGRPWLLWWAAWSVALVMLALFAHPWISGVAAPALDALAGPHHQHFPDALLVLEAAMRRLERWTGWLLLPLLAGVAARLCYAQLREREITGGEALREAAARLPRLVLVGAPWVLGRATLVALGASVAFQQRPMLALIARFGAGRPRRCCWPWAPACCR